jgi:hypothetical protein
VAAAVKESKDSVTTTSNHPSWDAVLALVSAGVRGRLRALAEGLDSVPFLSFVVAAVEADAAAGTAGAVSTTLLDSDVVVLVISRPEVSSWEEALRIATAAARLDARLDSRILNALTSASSDWPRDVSLAHVERALELIDRISDCRRLLPSLMKFVSVGDPKVRSKAVKLIARASQNRGWIESILSDPDRRVRSNLIEGLVAQIGRRAEPLLRRAARDSDHRVAVTALEALASFGDAESLERIQALAKDEREMWRRAAQWALAKLDKAKLEVTPELVNPSTTAPHPDA